MLQTFHNDWLSQTIVTPNVASFNRTHSIRNHAVEPKMVYNLGNFSIGGVGTVRDTMTENAVPIERRIEELVHTRLPDLVLFAKQWRHSAAEDVVQEAFMKLMKQKVFPDNPAAWLYTTVRNLSNNELRSQKRRKRREFDVQERKGLFDVPNTEQKEEIEHLIDALESLDLEYREVIVAKIWGGLTFEEIAEMTGSSRSSVHRKYQEAIKLLKAGVRSN
jgi:RNA polymerase sigma-70 factor (ECF subfamily)